MKEFTIDLHDGRGNQVYVLKIDQLAALEAVVKERNLEWESIRGQNIRHATVNDELKERIAALTADAPTINKKLLKEFMMMIIHCDEEVNKDGLCNCAWQIGQVLQKLERKNKRLEAIVEILELEKGILQEQKEIMKEQIAALEAERDRLREEKDALRDHLTFLDSLKQTEGGEE